MARREEQVRLTEADRTSQLQAAFLSSTSTETPEASRRNEAGDEVPDPHRDQNLNQLCNLMARILIRHEDSLQSIHSEDSFILYLNRAAQGIVPQLLQTARTGGRRANQRNLSEQA